MSIDNTGCTRIVPTRDSDAHCPAVWWRCNCSRMHFHRSWKSLPLTSWTWSIFRIRWCPTIRNIRPLSLPHMFVSLQWSSFRISIHKPTHLMEIFSDRAFILLSRDQPFVAHLHWCFLDRHRCVVVRRRHRRLHWLRCNLSVSEHNH